MARRVKAEVTGAKEIAANLKVSGQRWQNALKVALYLEGNNIMSLSKRRVPVDKGALQDSGYVTLPVEQNAKILVELGYGGAAKEYALYVHEIPSKAEGAPHPEQHKPGKRTADHEPPRTWKYLEHPVNERTPEIANNILKLAKAAFEAGAKPTKGANPTTPDG